MQCFTTKDGIDITFIHLCNERTATGFNFIASPEMGELVMAMSESELSKLMPPSEPTLPDDPEDWAAALIEHARMGDMPADSIMLQPIDIPTYWFDSGWEKTVRVEPTVSSNSFENADENTNVSVDCRDTPDAPRSFIAEDVAWDTIESEADIADMLEPFIPEGWQVWGFALDRGATGKRLSCALVKKNDPMEDADVDNDVFASYVHAGENGFVLETVRFGKQDVVSYSPQDGYDREWNPDLNELVSFVAKGL